MTDASPKPARALPLALIPLALLFFGFLFAGKLIDPPPVRAQAEAGRFDANAARERLARILGDETPHPVDSAALDVVREALLREIRAHGFQPEVQDAFACRPQPRGPLVDCARVRNIVFSMGPADAPAILAAAHYDSVPAAPGASDDGIGLAVWLEIARLLRDEQLTRRVVFLFSDGEEPGLLGAYSFANGDPRMQSAEALVNLEARGSRGPAIFFETNQPNTDAVAAFGAAPRGVANSVAANVYALLSNSSDVTVLSRPGLDVLNIALLDGLEDYHTPQDTFASQDPRSVQHMGDLALALTRDLAGAPDHGGTTPMVYTDIASYAFVAMPGWAAQLALGVCVLVAGFVFWRTGAEGRWRAFTAPLLAIVFAALLAAVAGFALGLIRPGAAYGFAFPEFARAWCILAALTGAVLALMVLHVRRDAVQAGAAGMLWFALLGFAFSFFLSGISILYVIPALTFAIFALIGLFWRPALTIGAVLAMLLAVLVWAPTLFLTELALGFEFPFATALLFAIPSLVWLGALVRAQRDAPWRGVAITLGAVMLVCVTASAFAPSATPQRPQALNINYFFNADSGEARILAGTAARALPRELTDAFSAEPLLPGDRLDTWTAPARAVAFPPPALEELSVTEQGSERIVRGRLRMNGAYRALIRMPNEARPLRAVVNGVAADFAETGGEGDYMSLACQGRACDGVEVAITLDAAGEAADWYIVGQFPGAAVPEGVRAMRARRPASATPIQLGDGALTLSRLRPIG